MNIAAAAATGRGRRRHPMAIATAMAGLLVYGGSPLALGLGEAEVESALGQRLAVILPVHKTAGTGWPQRCGWRLAHPPTRGDGALDRPQLTAGERSGRAVLILSTAGSVREPVVDFTVELACGSGYRLARDYTILLDPPAYGPRQQPAMRIPRSPPPSPSVVPQGARPPAPRPAPAGDRLTVNPGDTLSAIVARHYPGRRDGAALARAIVAANPQAFRGGDPDRLLAGARVSLPAVASRTIEAVPSLPAPSPPPAAPRMVEAAPPQPAPPSSPPASSPPAEAASRLRILSADEEFRYPGMRLTRTLDPVRPDVVVALAAPDGEPAISSEPETDSGYEAEVSRPPRAAPLQGPVEEAEGPATNETAAEAARQAQVELAAARERMAAMASEMAALQAQVQSLATELRQEQVRQRDSPWWLWLGGGVLLVLMLAVLLAWLARRRGTAGEIPFPVEERRATAPMAMPAAPSPPFTGDESRPPATEIREALDSVPPADGQSGKVPRSTERTQEIPLELLDPESETTGTTVEAEFLNLVEYDAASGDSAVPGGISEEQSRQLNRSVTVRLLEVELHLLYEQYGDAAEVLRDLIERESPDQPDMRPWSMAFSLYRQIGDRQAFADLERRFRARYNVVPPAWEEETQAPVDLETRYPHLVVRIGALWGSPEAEDFLNGLLLDDRQGERAGLEMAVAEEISFLRELLAVRQEGTGMASGGGG